MPQRFSARRVRGTRLDVSVLFAAVAVLAVARLPGAATTIAARSAAFVSVTPLYQSAIRSSRKILRRYRGSCCSHKVGAFNERSLPRPHSKPPGNSTLSVSSPPTGIYVHLPFCQRRCRYCDFAIVPVGSEGPSVGLWQDYTNALVEEIRRSAPPLDTTNNHHPIISSVYFGGGTPSLAPTAALSAIARALRDAFGSCLDPHAEWTIEMDPGTFDSSKARDTFALGFNRVSLGAQSFDDQILQGLGRQHTVHDTHMAVEVLRRAYSSTNPDDLDLNLSLDLISGVPGLTLAKWCETLQMAANLQPQHLSVYDLQVEPGTVFGSWYGGSVADPSGSNMATRQQEQRLRLPTDDESADMYRYTAGYLRSKGYEHYEVSSYASAGESPPRKPPALRNLPPSPYRSRHNQIYWHKAGEWHAFGLGATSCLGDTLLARPRAMSDYVAWVWRGMPAVSADSDANEATLARNNDYPRALAHVTMETPLDRAQRVVLTRLRTRDGLDLHWVRDTFGPECVAAILDGASLALDLGLAELTGGDAAQEESTSRSILRLIDPDGFLVSNAVLAGIFASLDAPDDAFLPRVAHPGVSARPPAAIAEEAGS